MQAQVLASQLPSGPDGEHGCLSRDGRQKDGTLVGQKQLASNFSSMHSVETQNRVHTSRYTETTGGLLRAGEMDVARTDTPTRFSDVSTSYQNNIVAAYLHDMYPVPITQQTIPPEVSIPHPTSSLNISPYLQMLDLSSSISTPQSTPTQDLLVATATQNLRGRTGSRTMTQAGVATTDCSTSGTPRTISSSTAAPTRNSGKERDGALPPLATTHRRPAPYPSNLTPRDSVLRPHCHARERLCLWHPLASAASTSRVSGLTQDDVERVISVLSNAWEEDRHASYGAGLLIYHVFCDLRNILEKDRAPTSQDLLAAFISSLAASYSGKTISNYLYGVCAWHILYRTSWAMNKDQLRRLQCTVRREPAAKTLLCKMRVQRIL